MKIIMAVVDGGNSPLYTEMRHYWNLYRKTREPHVFVYFIRFSDDPNLFKDDSPFYFDEETAILYKYGKDSYFNILEKTRGAIEYLSKKHNYEFDYFYRTNISSMFDFDKMIEYLENNPMDYGGKLENAFDEFLFPSGCGYVMSKRTCDIFLQHFDEMESQYDLLEDVAAGKIMQKYVLMTYIPRVTFSYTEDPDILDLLENDYREIYHYRCHSDENHTKTIYYMQKIYKKIYG
jgi:hypothetical protein